MIGEKTMQHDEIKFWTQTEYEKFAEAVADKPLSYFAFEILYWCGLRLGEMQALTPEDIDFERNTIRINKSYQRINRKDVITPPKTPKSNRTVYMPKSLGTELKCFLETLYGLKTTDRIFTVSKSYMHHGLIKVGSSLVPFANKFPKDTRLYRLMTTKLSDLSEK